MLTDKPARQCEDYTGKEIETDQEAHRSIIDTEICNEERY